MTRIFITGAGGFIGNALAQHLSRVGRTAGCHIGPAADDALMIPPGESHYYGSLPDLELCKEMFRGSEVVIHLAGPPSVARSFREEPEYRRVHLSGSKGVVEACHAVGVKRLIYVSSAEVYGPSPTPVSEDAAKRPRSPYGQIKLETEQMLAEKVRTWNMELVIIRPFSVIGAHAPSHSLLHEIIAQASTGQQIQLNNLKPVRDYVHVDDLARAIERAIDTPIQAPVSTYNVAGGKGYSVKQLAETVVRVMGRNIPIGTRARGDRPLDKDVDYLVADIGAASQELEWRPELNLNQSIERTLEETLGVKHKLEVVREDHR